MSSNTAHTKLVNEIIAAIYERWGKRACVQKTNVINAVAVGRDGRMRRVESLQPGTADIMGCICGFYFEIEAKVPPDKQRVSQKERQAAVEAAGGYYFVATLPGQVVFEIEATL